MAARPVPYLLQVTRGFATKRSAFKSGRRPTSQDGAVATHPQGAVAVTDEWKEVKDETSGQLYYWNESTNETTALGEPRPGPEGRLVPQQQQGDSGGLNIKGMVAAGAGLGIAHAVVGSIFGGGGGGSE